MLLVDYDDATGIITTVATGFSSVEEFDAYLLILEGFMARSISRHGQWLHLVDAKNNPVQPRESAEYTAKRWNAKPREDGYTAYVAHSTLAKLQIKRMRPALKKAFFAQTQSGRDWLLEQVRTLTTG